MDLASAFTRFLIVVAVIIIAGILGSYCRYFFDGDNNKRFLGIVILGIAAACIVPLFLNIGKSHLLSELFEIRAEGVNSVYENILILFGFCILASLSARSFVNALARTAFNIATEAQKEAVKAKKEASEAKEQATEAKDLTAETAENIQGKMLAEEGGDSAKFAAQTAPVFEGTEAEKRVLSALRDSRFSRRSITGISNDTKLPRSDVRTALDALVKRGAVVQAPSQQTGTLLYQAVLGSPDPNAKPGAD